MGFLAQTFEPAPHMFSYGVLPPASVNPSPLKDIISLYVLGSLKERFWTNLGSLKVPKSHRACSHHPGTTHCPGQLTDPGIKFASVHSLTPVTVHIRR